LFLERLSPDGRELFPNGRKLAEYVAALRLPNNHYFGKTHAAVVSFSQK
jgi:hypothetical protein